MHFGHLTTDLIGLSVRSPLKTLPTDDGDVHRYTLNARCVNSIIVQHFISQIAFATSQSSEITESSSANGAYS